jgi:hypothetical protein
MIFNSKKGIALMFLFELLMIIGFISLVFAGATKIITHEGKFREFDIYNVGLFVERIPAIEDNFYYRIELITEN